MTAWWLALALACSGANKPPPAAVDGDGDGYTVGEGDCDDADADVYPGAVELPGDGVDQDCDGQDAPALVPDGLVISELMVDPAAVDGDLGEWFEVFNPTDGPLDLFGMVVEDGDDSSFAVAVHHEVAAGGHAVLGRSSDRDVNGDVLVDIAYGDALKLGNDGDALRLLSAGALIDEVVYDLTFSLVPGASLSLTPDALDTAANDDPASWCAATSPYGLGDLGTPGAPNDVCAVGIPVEELVAGDLVLTELMADPAAVDGDFGEWFELRNASGAAIDLDRLVVRDGGDAVFVVSQTLAVQPGALAVFAANGEPALNGGLAPDVVFGDALKFGNSGDAVLLERPDGGVLDAVGYDEDSWTLVDGAAIALDPAFEDAAANDDPAAWCVASTPYGDGDLGTPGEDNPACPPLEIGVGDLVAGELIVTEVMKDPTVGSPGEWIELLNRTGSAVDLAGLTVRDGGDDLFVVDVAVHVPAHGRVVLGSSALLAENGGAPVAFAWGDQMRLGNGADEVVLEVDGVQIDAVAYDNGVTFPDPTGASMAVSESALDDNDLGASWCVEEEPYGDGDLGTPGESNDCG